MMKKLLALTLSLLMVASLFVGLILPAAAEDGLYTVTFESKTYRATAQNADGAKVYYLTVTTEAPAEMKAAVTYWVDGNTPFNGASEPGTYTITARLPQGFVDASGNPVSELTATLTLTRIEQNTAVIVFDANDKEANAFATIKTVEVPAKLLKKFAASKVLSFAMTNGANGAKYTIRISIDSSIYAVKTKKLTAKNLYLYADGKLTSLSEQGYTVALKDGYYEVTGVPADAEMTLVIGAEKVFCPWWIILIILLILLLVCMYLVGRAKTKREEEEAAIAATAAEAAAKGETAKEEDQPAEEAPAEEVPAEETPAESSEEPPKNE